MSQENVERVRKFWEAFEHTSDLEKLAEPFHHDVVARDLSHLPDTPETLRGRSAIVAVWEKWLEELDDWKIEVSEYIDADPWVVCAVRWHGTGKGSDVPIDWHLADAYEVRDGKIVRAVFGYANVSEALEAVGLSE